MTRLNIIGYLGAESVVTFLGIGKSKCVVFKHNQKIWLKYLVKDVKEILTWPTICVTLPLSEQHSFQ